MKTVLIILILYILLLAGCHKSSLIQLSDDLLPTCPDSPNCVSSLAENSRHKIDPLSVYISGQESLQLLKKIIKSMKRTAILWENERSLYAVFKTRMGFVDDVQFLVDEKAGVIHLYSASRIGYWDLGMNRKRIETIREEYKVLTKLKMTE